MRTFKRHQPHSLPFWLFLAVVIASLLLPAALAPRANAGSTDYWDFEDPLGLRPRPAPELFSQPQGVLINQPLAFNENFNLALNVASGGQPGGFQPLQVDANFSWTGFTAAGWNNSGNWSPGGGPPGPGDTAVFNQAFINQPNLTTGVSVGTVWMTTGVVQNVTLSGPGTLNLTGLGMLGTGILVDNTNAVTLTITAPVSIGNSQAWTNNSGNLFTVSGNVALGGNALTVNGTGDTLISGAIAGAMGSALTMDGSGTLTLTANNAYPGGTTVNSGTLLVNGTGDLGGGAVTVNSGGTLGGNSTAQVVAHNTRLTVAAGGTLAPGNGGNNTATYTVGFLTLASTSNFKIDINGTAAGSFDKVVVESGGGALGAQIGGSNLLVHVGTTLSVGQTFQIMTHAGGFTGTFAQGTTVVGDNGTVFSVTYDNAGGQIVLTVTAAPVPEPSTWMGGALAIAGLAFTQRRRLRKLIARRCAIGSA